MVGRRTDTRARIQQVALEMFTEQGYDKTTLREVADRLQITRPALYYHFKAKEDILVSVIDDLTASMEELIQWARAQPATPEARQEILRRIADFMGGSMGHLARFARLNETVIKSIPAGERLRDHMLDLLSVLTSPDADPVKQLESKLAVIAVILTGVPVLFGPELSQEERAAVAMRVATKLISD
ncbi:TetR/AcrR family transcriptional regulator [Thermopolyspora sp. NPDC052614]|uniref:TetR/AcrR family transcriptional regulator n=1 Tax=Thermopolyspora sp. NPDC052614 TaxID=3155682 RepID=UPI003421CD5F